MSVRDPLMPRGGLLAVHAHPDDETLATGALLATWAASGMPVTLVTCTRGERGEVIALPGTASAGLAHLEGDGPGLAAYRETELAAALDALGDGAIDHAFLDSVDLSDPTRPMVRAEPGTRWEDSGMAWVAPGIAGPAQDAPDSAFARVPLDDAASRLAAVVRARRPSVVVTYEPSGGYGHPDHVRAHQVAARAVELAADPAVAGEPWHVRELWEAVVPEADLRAARRALALSPEATGLARAASLRVPDAEGVLPPVAKPVSELLDVVEVDVAPVLDRVLAALRAYSTQVQHATSAPAVEPAGGGGLLGWYALSNGVLAPLMACETYAVRTLGAPPPGAPVGSAR